jgi:hypothetical protein
MQTHLQLKLMCVPLPTVCQYPFLSYSSQPLLAAKLSTRAGWAAYLSSGCTFLCPISDKLELLEPARSTARVARPRLFLEGCQCVRKFSWRSFCMLQWCRLLSEHVRQIYIQIQETREQQLKLMIPLSRSRVWDRLQCDILQPRIPPPPPPFATPEL